MKALLFSKTDKIKIITFAAVTYGLPWLFFPWVQAEENGDILAMYMMILPTFGIVLGRIICEHRIQGWLHWLYTIAFTGTTAVMLLCVAGVMSGEMAASIILTFRALSIVLLLGSIIDEQELEPFKNFKKVISVYLVFTVIIQISNLPEIMHAGAANTAAELFSELLITPVNILVIESIYFFGEEYAWRGCLQGHLQNIFGKRMGVIVLGIIWELWHMPLWFKGYGLSQEKMFVLLVLMRILHTVGCAVFFGWAYMKTKNIWSCVLLHGFNNSATLAFDWMAVGGTAESISALDYIMIFIASIIMLFFLLAKEYRREERI